MEKKANCPRKPIWFKRMKTQIEANFETFFEGHYFFCNQWFSGHLYDSDGVFNNLLLINHGYIVDSKVDYEMPLLPM